MPAQPRVEADGHSIKVTNLDKVMYPVTGTTKGEVIGYYQAIAPWLIAHAWGRPVTRKRWVNGVGTPEHPGEAFFQKNLEASQTPEWVHTRKLEGKHGDGNTHPLADNVATVVWLAQLASLEIHVPQWRFGPTGPKNPDRLVFDLDPGEGAGLPECVAVAHLVREVLDGIGMSCVPVTSGSKGIHLYAGLDGSHTCEEASELARQLADSLAAMRPELITANMNKAVRGGKVFIDWSQNNGSKTTIAPYSLRGRFTPTVATPRTWEELTPEVAHLEFVEVLARVESIGDPLAVLAPDDTDRLTTYRSMRDASKTPEPVPEGFTAAGAGNTFVIQEHHARRLHWDFRLERGGALVSWALPKGPPTDPKRNHLAVHTEDHPLEYANFEGTIPQGEYGGGEVSIWDWGTYSCEKWVDDKEVIATLQGQPDGGLGGGPRKYALIRTGKGDQDKNWLIHLMKDSPAQ